MDASQNSEIRNIKKRGSGHPLPHASSIHAAPTAFFLKSEKEMDKDTQAGKVLGAAGAAEPLAQSMSVGSSMGDSRFGVQSLEDTIASVFSEEGSLLHSTASAERALDVSPSEASPDGTPVTRRKRKAGNPVHPKIMATGQRILSSEWIPTLSSANDSPKSLSSISLSRELYTRRSSITSSINMSQPLTPVRMSPHPRAATPSSHRSSSPKSFRLSDEDCSVADDTASQALLSSSGDEDEDEDIDPPSQFVMPSLAMPARRPFTEQGRQISRARIMVMGPRRVGKTSFIQSLVQSCEHIVHVDPITYDQTDIDTVPSEVTASTRPLPPWWAESEMKRKRHRRKSVGGSSVLERNLVFIDTPGLDDDDGVQRVLDIFEANLQRTANFEAMSEDELLALLSGEGGTNVDAVVYLFAPRTESLDEGRLSVTHQDLLRSVSRYTNLIPLISHAESLSAEDLTARKRQVSSLLENIGIKMFRFADTQITQPAPSNEVPSDAHEESEHFIEPLSVSSALGDDKDVIDASLLMSSQYIRPLAPSELPIVAQRLLHPSTIARLRHISAMKFLTWRQDRRLQRLTNPLSLPPMTQYSGGVTDADSADPAADPGSKVLVPYGTSSYFRSASPSVSERSALERPQAPTSALATYTALDPYATEPFRQVRLAKWAQDLQRSLGNERRRYQQMYANVPGDWISGGGDDPEKPDHALIALTSSTIRAPSRGRLGGALAVIDPRDPLGVLAFTQAVKHRGIVAVQLAGSAGVVGALAYWLLQHLHALPVFLGGVGNGTGMEHVTNAHVVGPPSSGHGRVSVSSLRLDELLDWRAFWAWLVR